MTNYNNFPEDNLEKQLTLFNERYNNEELNDLFSYVVSDSNYISDDSLNELRTIFTNLNKDYYNDSPELAHKIKSILQAISYRLDSNLRGSILISNSTGGLGSDTNKFIIKDLDQVSIKNIEENIHTTVTRHTLINLSTQISSLTAGLLASNDNEVIDGNLNKIQEFINTFTTIKDNEKSLDEMAPIIITSEGGNPAENLLNIYKNTQSDAPVWKVYNQALGEMINGGYKGGCLYVLVAAPSQGKSLLLLDSCIQIKMSNRGEIKNGLKPIVVYLSCENTLNQTIARLYAMRTGRNINDDLACNQPQMVLLDGLLKATDEHQISIGIQCIPDGSQTTNYIHKLFKELNKIGYYPIALAQDYIKRIEPARKYFQLVDKYGCVTNELRNIAITYNIPVITAAQFNRDGYDKVYGYENNFSTSGQDLVKRMSIENIADSIEIPQNADYVIFLQPEYILVNEDGKEGKPVKYLGLSRAKCRDEVTVGDPNNTTVFSPYNRSKIALVDDRASPRTLNSLKEYRLKQNQTIADLGIDLRHKERYRIPAMEYETKSINELDSVNPNDFDKVENNSLDSIFMDKAAALDISRGKIQMCTYVNPDVIKARKKEICTIVRQDTMSIDAFIKKYTR